MTGSLPFSAGLAARRFPQLLSAAVFCLAAVPCLTPGAARADAVALVEDIGEPRPGVQFMDYLSPGQMIALHPGEQLVIDYLRSCTRETIVGGVVSIGVEKSVVVGGTVTSETVECDGGKLELTAEQAGKSGVMVFRGGNLVKDTAAGDSGTPAPWLIYGTAPLIELKGGGKLVIERLDHPGEKHVATIAKNGRRTVFDCAKEGWALQPGGLYRAALAGREVRFRIADTAKPGAAPPVARLLRL
jgi:hypothetical protein